MRRYLIVLIAVALVAACEKSPEKAKEPPKPAATTPPPAIAPPSTTAPTPPMAATTPAPGAEATKSEGTSPPATPPATASTESLGTADGEQAGTRAVITDLRRGGGTLTLKFTIYNDSNGPLNTGGRFDADGYSGNGGRSFSGLHLIDGVSKKKYFVVADSDHNCLCSEHVDDLKPKTQVQLWAKFPAPPENIQKVTVEIPHFIPVEDVAIR